MKDILILGGTGVMGKYLVDILSKKSCYLIYVTTRENRTCTYKDVNYVIGNAMNLDFLDELLRSRRWSAIIDFMRYTPEQFKHRHRLLLDNTNQYVFLSSARVYADSKRPIVESCPRLLDVVEDEAYLNTNEYALSKARQEDILMHSGMGNWTIIRPYITFSKDRIQLTCMEKENWLRRAFLNKTIIVSKDMLDKHTTVTSGYDVATGIASIIGQESAFEEAFHITCPICYTWKEILIWYQEFFKNKTGSELKIKIIDSWIPEMGGSLEQVKYDRVYNRCFSNEKISRYINVKSFEDCKTSLLNVLSDFEKSPSFKSVNWMHEAYLDRMTGDWEPIRNVPGLKSRIKYLMYRILKIK